MDDVWTIYEVSIVQGPIFAQRLSAEIALSFFPSQKSIQSLDHHTCDGSLILKGIEPHPFSQFQRKKYMEVFGFFGTILFLDVRPCFQAGSFFYVGHFFKIPILFSPAAGTRIFRGYLMWTPGTEQGYAA